MTTDITIDRLIEAAAGLTTEVGDSNPEYDRALVELICEFVPGGTDAMREECERMIKTYALLEALPPGSIITTPFPDLEGNVVERTSDRMWLVTGEENLMKTLDIIRATDAPITILRRGYGHKND